MSGRARQLRVQRLLKKTNPLDQPDALAYLGWLQRVLPIAIISAVVVYEILFEWLFAERVPSQVRFGIEVLVFGAFGAGVTWIVLEWIRRRFEHDMAERERAAQEIRELNRRLEQRVAERTQALSRANEELRNKQRTLEKANAELQQLDALKSEFVSLVSHELRAPLANISGSLQLLLSEDEASMLTVRHREMLAVANEQAERLARLVKGILNVSRADAGQIPYTPEAFDILPLLDRAVEQWRACDTEHEWRGPAHHNLPSVWADRDRVEEVLMNLLDNAYKYSAVGATIQVDARVAENQLILSVSDQGKGIPPQELEKIFDKFHRVERGDARQTYGYGLGLYISRKLIENMGGALWAESEMGRGSEFYFSLPLAGQADK